MATTRKAVSADDADSYSARGGEAAVQATDCAACGAPLPAGHRYLCAACVEDSARRARAILAALRPSEQPTAATAPDTAPALDEDDPTRCPTCGMLLDASGRCAGCVATVRR
jgi:hypothetical protein